MITPDQSGKPATGRVRLGKMKITREQIKQIIKEELEAILDETGDEKESPDDIVARFPSSRPDEPDQVIYRWQQDEFDERERALKAFNKRKKK